MRRTFLGETLYEYDEHIQNIINSEVEEEITATLPPVMQDAYSRLSGHGLYFDVVSTIKRNILPTLNHSAVSKFPLHSWSNNSCRRKYPFNPVPTPDKPLVQETDPTKIPIGNCAEATAGSKLLKA